MTFESLSWVWVGAVFLTASAIMVSRNWRVTLAALGFQYLAMFGLAALRLPLVMSAAKLIAGWMALAALGMTKLGAPPEEEERESQFFHATLMGAVAAAAAGMTPRVAALIPGLDLPVIAGGLILLGGGVIHLAVASSPFRVILGLLTMLTGFEIIYSALETSILVAGLLAVVTLSLALAGSYLMTAGSFAPEEDREELL